MTSRYISTKETAQIIRKRLKTQFPNTKFSVRYQSYSMGSHVNVSWTDGPTQSDITESVGCFYGSGFDGMCDSSYTVSHWLQPDGTVTFAHSSGTATQPEVDEPAPPNAELVHFGGSSPSIYRTESAKFIEDVKCCYALLDPSERSALMEKSNCTRVLSPYEMPDSWSMEDPNLSDFGDKAERLFEQMARSIPA